MEFKRVYAFQPFSRRFFLPYTVSLLAYLLKPFTIFADLLGLCS
jgi:hypothetical protein